MKRRVRAGKAPIKEVIDALDAAEIKDPKVRDALICHFVTGFSIKSAAKLKGVPQDILRSAVRCVRDSL
jgi:hypothetical protein